MKTNWQHLDAARKRSGPYATTDGERDGAFYIARGRVNFIIIASQGDDSIPWEHVSARAMDIKGNERVPTWEEMCWIKGLFWEREECVVQYHPPESEYVNNHPHVLHLWKPLGLDLPRPPSIAVGIRP